MSLALFGELKLQRAKLEEILVRLDALQERIRVLEAAAQVELDSLPSPLAIPRRGRPPKVQQ